MTKIKRKTFTGIICMLNHICFFLFCLFESSNFKEFFRDDLNRNIVTKYTKRLTEKNSSHKKTIIRSKVLVWKTSPYKNIRVEQCEMLTMTAKIYSNKIKNLVQFCTWFSTWENHEINYEMNWHLHEEPTLVFKITDIIIFNVTDGVIQEATISYSMVPSIIVRGSYVPIYARPPEESGS